MPSYEMPVQQKPQDKKEADPLELSTGQKVAIVGTAIVLVLASRGRISPSRAHKLASFGVKSILGIGALHMSTQIPDHGPPDEHQLTVQTPSVDELLELSEGPDDEHVFISTEGSKTKTLITIEQLKELVRIGVVKPTPQNQRVLQKINMEKLWNADP